MPCLAGGGTGDFPPKFLKYVNNFQSWNEIASDFLINLFPSRSPTEIQIQSTPQY